MRTELITIETDTTPLDGAYYEPDHGATAGEAAVLENRIGWSGGSGQEMRAA